MDKTFEAEQTHLSTTYEKLQDIEHDLQGQLSGILSEVATDELNFDFDADIHVETMAELEAVNRIIDTYNIAADGASPRSSASIVPSCSSSSPTSPRSRSNSSPAASPRTSTSATSA